MPLIRWDPFDDLVSLQERMNKLFEESMARSTSSGQEPMAGAWSPAVDILEEKDEIVLKAELPGVALEDVDLQIKDDVLILRGFYRALGENLAKYEAIFGEIHVPGEVTLADHLFRPPTSPENPPES